eukprot:COSAG06_NODE_50750_length_316_cov_1.175115_1_plen_22_part_10
MEKGSKEGVFLTAPALPGAVMS